MSVRINFASVEELQTIPGVGEKLAGLIMSIREKSGNIIPDILIALTRGRVLQKTIDDIDFSFNVELPDELDSSFESLDLLESTVKKSQGLVVQHQSGVLLLLLCLHRHVASACSFAHLSCVI